MPFTFGDDPVNSGDSSAVNCMIVKGDLPLQIHWTLNGQPIVNEVDNMHVVRLSARLSSLSVDGIDERHRGVFRCIASNQAGRSEMDGELKVNGNCGRCLAEEEPLITFSLRPRSFAHTVRFRWRFFFDDQMLSIIVLVLTILLYFI